jgi:hypothetical protein
MEFFSQLDPKRMCILCLKYFTSAITNMETTRSLGFITDTFNVYRIVLKLQIIHNNSI